MVRNICVKFCCHSVKYCRNKLSPRGGRDDTPPADGSSTVAKIAADLRPSADGSAARTSLVVGGGWAAGNQRAYSLGNCAMGQADGRIALFQNAPLRRRHKKGNPQSITERRVPELIPVLCSQPTGDVSHKLGGRLPLLSARPAVTFATLKRVATNFAAWWTNGVVGIMFSGTMGVNSLPKTATWQRRGCDLNPGPSVPESSTLTTRLPRHPGIKRKQKLDGKPVGECIHLTTHAQTNGQPENIMPTTPFVGQAVAEKSSFTRESS